MVKSVLHSLTVESEKDVFPAFLLPGCDGSMGLQGVILRAIARMSHSCIHQKHGVIGR